MARGCKLLDWCTHAKHARSWSVAPAIHYRTKVLGWLGRLLTAWTRDSTQSRGQAARTPCLAKYDVSHSFSPYYIYTLIPTIHWELPKRIFERETLEKTRLTHLQSLLKRLFKFLYPLPFHCQILERLFTKTFFSPYPFLWEGYLVLWEVVKKEPISHWLMLWSSSRIREAKKEIGSA